MSAPSNPATAPIALALAGVAVRSLRDEEVMVVDEVNWEVRVGEFWVIAGLQGSGKTDLLMTLGGLMPPAHGSYTLFGEPMPIFDESRMAMRLRLGLVFEGGQLFNHLTIADNISLPMRYHRNLSNAGVAEELNRFLEIFDLSAFANSTPGALGRNWQRRAGLARALALRPEVLLLDSPLTGLDLPHTSWWLQTLDSLSKGHPLLDHKPITLVVTAADLRPWRGHARQFATLRHHRLNVLGTWDQVKPHASDALREVWGEGSFGERV